MPSLGQRRVYAWNAQLVDDLFVEGFCLTVPPGSVSCGEVMGCALEAGEDAKELVVDSGVLV